MDIVEVCGGEARTSSLAGRRHLKAGENFDLVTDVDLNDEIQQAAVERYCRQQRSLVFDNNGHNNGNNVCLATFNC